MDGYGLQTENLIRTNNTATRMCMPFLVMLCRYAVRISVGIMQATRPHRRAHIHTCYTLVRVAMACTAQTPPQHLHES